MPFICYLFGMFKRPKQVMINCCFPHLAVSTFLNANTFFFSPKRASVGFIFLPNRRYPTFSLYVSCDQVKCFVLFKENVYTIPIASRSRCIVFMFSLVQMIIMMIHFSYDLILKYLSKVFKLDSSFFSLSKFVKIDHDSLVYQS